MRVTRRRRITIGVRRFNRAWSFQLQGRYYADVKRDRRWVEGVDVDNNKVSSMTWFNGRIAYGGDTGNGHSWTVGLNIQNLFDEHIPIIPSFSSRGGSQITSNDYDTFGRRYALNMNYNF